MNNKTIIFIRLLIGIGIFIIAAGLAVTLIFFIKPAAPTTTTGIGPKAADVLMAFVKQTSQAKELQSFGIGIPKNSHPTTFFVKSDNPPTYIGLQSSHLVNISGATALTEDALTSVETGVTHTLTLQNFQKQATPQLPGSIATYTTESGTYCSLLGGVGATQLTLVCADRVDYTDTLTTTQTLLKQWSGLSGAHYDYVVSSRLQSDDGTYQLSLFLLVDSKTNVPVASLAYTKKGSQSWQYAADTLANDGPNNRGGKIGNNVQTAQLLSDENYGPLLKKLFSGTDISH